MKCLCKNNKNNDNKIKTFVLPENCNHIFDENNFVPIGYTTIVGSEERYNITIDKSYQIYGLLIYSDELYYLIQDDNNKFDLFNSNLFQIIDRNFYYDWWAMNECIIDNKVLRIISFEEFVDYNNFMGLISGKKELIEKFLFLK